MKTLCLILQELLKQASKYNCKTFSMSIFSKQKARKKPSFQANGLKHLDIWPITWKV